MTSHYVESVAGQTPISTDKNIRNVKYTSPTEYNHESNLTLSQSNKDVFTDDGNITCGVYTIENASSTNLYAGTGAAVTDKDNVSLRDADAALNIRWIVHESLSLGDNTYYIIRNVGNGKVLNVLDGSPVPTTNIETVEDSRTYASHWNIKYSSDSKCYLKNLVCGQYMTANTEDSVLTADNNDSESSQWIFNTVLEMESKVSIESNTYYIISNSAGSDIYMKASGEDDGDNIIWETVKVPPASASYQFFVTVVENFTHLYNIKCTNAADDKYITVDYGTTGNGSAIVVGQYPSSFDTRFYFDTTSDDVYGIRNIRSGLYLTMDESESSDQIILGSNPHDSSTTQWKLVVVPVGNPQISSLYAGIPGSDSNEDERIEIGYNVVPTGDIVIHDGGCCKKCIIM